MAAFISVLKDDFRSKAPLIVWLTVSLAVAVSGPFGSYAKLSFGERLLYWPILIAVAVIVSSAIRAFVHGFPAMRGTLRGAVVTAFLISATLSLPLHLAVNWHFDPMNDGLPGFLEVFLVIFSLSLGICALRIAVADDAAPQTAPEPVVELTPRLHRRIEPALQGQIWAISVRDHYVDVQTERGKVSLLMRFTDAMAEAEPTLGAQVHRSHWVAWQGVASVCRDGAKEILTLKNGHQIPVSRNHRDKVDAQFPPMVSLKDVAA